ncbi:MAG: response regulator [Polyangiaceae bacterium]
MRTDTHCEERERGDPELPWAARTRYGVTDHVPCVCRVGFGSRKRKAEGSRGAGRDDDSRELLCELLGEMGATCIPASSGNEAFAHFSETPPDILVSDLWMCDGDGFDLVRRIRALPPEQGGLVPAIAVSAASNVEEALMAGYHVLIAKPYDPTKIADAIEEFAHAETPPPSVPSPWTLSSPRDGTVVIAFAGHVKASHMRACVEHLLPHLRAQPCEVVADFRQLTQLSLAAASVAERAVWPMRHSIRRVSIVGGSRAARLVASAACRSLGLAYTFDDD